MALPDFHPAVIVWFEKTFSRATDCQLQAWSAIRSGQHTLVAAPTGSGKTLAAFLSAINELVLAGLGGELTDQTSVVYVSPLKALSNDIHKNLELPLQGINQELQLMGLPEPAIRTFVRTGDTSQTARAMMRRNPPHIIVTTPESLYILLTSDSGREMLRGVRSVIIDEIHALAGNKRGSHLALSLERLEQLSSQPLQRIGLSATQKPIQTVANFLVGSARRDNCRIVDSGHGRARDVQICVPDSPLEAVASLQVWDEVYEQLTRLIESHATTLIFVNTRRMAERLAHHLSETLGEENVMSHHGSLSREKRLLAEQRLKAGDLRVLVATASLELGIDIGHVDLVCQIGSTRAIGTFLQRVGRSGHSIDGLPKGRLFPLSRDELVESAALLDAVRRGELDELIIPCQPLDVLSQQIVAMVACEEWQVDELYQRLCQAWPYRDLQRQQYDDVIRMLSDGFSTRRGRRSAWLHHDRINQRLRARRGAKLTAVTCGGAIPDNADYRVMQEPAGLFIGTLDEDFAIESMAGDIFQLGNTSWKVLRVEAGTVRVEDAHGQPPNIPFWFGEAPSRSTELSEAVGRLREEIQQRLVDQQQALDWLTGEVGIELAAARQIVDYLAVAYAALGGLPTRNHLILERFFDESGGMQLVLHAPYGSRLNRAWGLALRKRFCRSFNFELQAAATEDAIVLSLGETHSFPLADVWQFLHSASVREVLIQALLDAPMFASRWRWNASCALAIPRFRGGKKVPPNLLRMNAEDLISVVFPDQLACLENINGNREIPEHPLVTQTIHDCLAEAMDIDLLEQLLGRLEAGELQLSARDLTAPSPMAQEILNARPYAFLDDAPLEERRTRAVISRRWMDTDEAADLGRLDPAAIERVRAEAWPDAQNADELHDALLLHGFLSEAEIRHGARNGTPNNWPDLLKQLHQQGRVVALQSPLNPDGPVQTLWLAVEMYARLHKLLVDWSLVGGSEVPTAFQKTELNAEQVLIEITRARLQALGPVTQGALSAPLCLPESVIQRTLLALEQEGFVMRGRYSVTATTQAEEEEWCERRLLARIHRYTVQRLRKQIEPVSIRDYTRFLLEWQHLSLGTEVNDRPQGPAALALILQQLEGFAVSASCWEGEVLRARLPSYRSDWLDMLCMSGAVSWVRMKAVAIREVEQGSAGLIRSAPISLLPRSSLSHWQALGKLGGQAQKLSANAQRLRETLQQQGASFFDDLLQQSGLLKSQLEQAMAELAGLGLLTADSFMGLRALLKPANSQSRRHARRTRVSFMPSALQQAGRWSLITPTSAGEPIASEEQLEYCTRLLLRRYAVLMRPLLERESHMPAWRDLLVILRRMEARGEIRGGRFVEGIAGEQYALPEAVPGLRAMRQRADDEQLIMISATDPLNLLGILHPGDRLPALHTNRLVICNGEFVAVKQAAEVRYLRDMPNSSQWRLRDLLIRDRVVEASDAAMPQQPSLLRG